MLPPELDLKIIVTHENNVHHEIEEHIENHHPEIMMADRAGLGNPLVSNEIPDSKGEIDPAPEGDFHIPKDNIVKKKKKSVKSNSKQPFVIVFQG